MPSILNIPKFHSYKSNTPTIQISEDPPNSSFSSTAPLILETALTSVARSNASYTFFSKHKSPIDFNAKNIAQSMPKGLYGNSTLPKWFHRQFSLLNPFKKQLTRIQKEEMILAIKQEIFSQQELNPQQLQQLKKTWAKVLSYRELPAKQRKNALKEMILESIQGDEKIYKKLKKQWRAGGALWGGGLGMPYLLLASGGYLGLIGKAALSIGATAVTALPNGYLEIGLETAMGMIYDAEPAIEKGLLNAMSYGFIHKVLNEPTFEILLNELKQKHADFLMLENEINHHINIGEQVSTSIKKNLIKDLMQNLKNELQEKYKLVLPFSYSQNQISQISQNNYQTKSLNNRQILMNYEKKLKKINQRIQNMIDHLTKFTDTNTVQDFAEKTSALNEKIETQKMLLKFAQDATIHYLTPIYEQYAKQNAQTKSGFCDASRALVSGLGLILALGLSAGGVASTLHIPPLGLSGAVLGFTLCARIIASSFDKSRLRQSRIENNLTYADVEKKINPEKREKKIHLQFNEILDPKGAEFNYDTFQNQYTEDDIDEKKVQALWKTATQTRATWIEKAIAHELSKSQLKIEKHRDRFLSIFNILSSQESDENQKKPKNKSKYLRIFELLTQQKEFDLLRNDTNLSTEQKFDLLREKQKNFAEIAHELKKIEMIENNLSERSNNQNDKKILYSLHKILDARDLQTGYLEDFQHFKNLQFSKLKKSSLIYKCLVNDKFLLKVATKARYQISGVVASQVMRNVGSSMGTTIFSPLFINTIGLSLEEATQMQEFNTAKMAGAAFGTAVLGGMASHDKHSRQDGWFFSSTDRNYYQLSNLDAHQQTLYYMDYAFINSKNQQQLLQISIEDIAPTYNKTYSFKQRLGKQVNSAIDVALYMPFRHASTWFKAHRKINEITRILRKNKNLFAT